MMKILKSCLATMFAIIAPLAFGQPTMRAHMINVGQGSATLYEFPCGMVLVDSGGESSADVDRLVKYIKKVFALRPDLNKTLDEVILTHSHLDHAMGLKKIAQNFTIKGFVDSGYRQGATTNNFISFLESNYPATQIEAIPESKPRGVADKSGYSDEIVDPVKCDDCDPEVKILTGAIASRPSGWSKSAFENPNNQSLMIKFRFGSSTFLVTGDAEELALKRALNFYHGTDTLDVEVLTSGHHGSNNGLTLEFLDAVSPSIALISSGDPSHTGPKTANAYGHPRESTVNLFENLLAELPSPRSKTITVYTGSNQPKTMRITKAIYGTAWDGNVVIEADLGGAMTFKTWN